MANTSHGGVGGLGRSHRRRHRRGRNPRRHRVVVGHHSRARLLGPRGQSRHHALVGRQNRGLAGRQSHACRVAQG